MQEIDRWNSLINPYEPIPPRIEALTGISNDMVEDAPGFHEVADDVERILKDCVFVAHNVGFDYAFIRGHFEAMDRSWQRPKLCTVGCLGRPFPDCPLRLGRPVRRKRHSTRRPPPRHGRRRSDGGVVPPNRGV